MLSGTPAPSSNRTCSFPAYGSPSGTSFISFAPLRPSAPFHIDSDGCSSMWTSGFRRAATLRIVPYCSLSTLLFSPFDLHRPFYTQRPFAPLLGHRFATRCRSGDTHGHCPLLCYYGLIRLLLSLTLLAVLPSSLAELSRRAASFAPPRSPCPNRVGEAMLVSRT